MNPTDPGRGGSFGDRIRAILDDTNNLPAGFVGWVSQTAHEAVSVHEPIPTTQVPGYFSDSISCRLTRTADSAVLTVGVRNAITWQAARWNPGSMWSLSDPTKVVCHKAGKYIANTMIGLDSGLAQVEIWKNNTTREAVSSNDPGVTTVLDLAVGDYVEVYVFPPSVGRVVHKENNSTPEFSVSRICP